MRLFRRSLLCLVVVTALLIGGAVLLNRRSGQLPIPPAGSVEEMSVQVYDKMAKLTGERAEQARQLFIPARRDDSPKKWEGSCDVTMKLRDGTTKSYFLFHVNASSLGIYKVNGQYFRCEAENQLNPLFNLAGIEVDESLLPVDLFKKGDVEKR